MVPGCGTSIRNPPPPEPGIVGGGEGAGGGPARNKRERHNLKWYAIIT